jgi:molybdopterin-binding protein
VGLSARNLYEARITSVENTGLDLTLRCSISKADVALVRVTRQAGQALDLHPGRRVVLAVKSHSVRVG